MMTKSARRRLLAIWAVFASLVVAIVLLERTDRPTLDDGHGHTPADHAARMLLPLPLSEVGAIEIVNAGTIHRFERDSDGRWFYHGTHGKIASVVSHEHRPDPALSERIESALSGFERTRLERRISLERGVQEYGLAVPRLLVLIYRAKDATPLMQIAVGDLAPDALSRYIIALGRPWASTIANYQIDNLLDLVHRAEVANASHPAPDPS